MVQNGRDCTPLHPKGIQARILLTSVFGPYAHYDEYEAEPSIRWSSITARSRTSRALLVAHVSPLVGTDADPAEHLSPEHPARLPYPETFERELTTHHYDIVGSAYASAADDAWTDSRMDFEARRPATG